MHKVARKAEDPVLVVVIHVIDLGRNGSAIGDRQLVAVGDGIIMGQVYGVCAVALTLRFLKIFMFVSDALFVPCGSWQLVQVR